MLWSVSILATKTVEQMELVPAVVQAVHANVRMVTMENFVMSDKRDVNKIAMVEELVIMANVIVTLVSYLDIIYIGGVHL